MVQFFWPDENAAVFRLSTDSFAGLSNMTNGFPLRCHGLGFSGPEAFYQALKFPGNPGLQRSIGEAPNGMLAKMLAYRPESSALLRPDWDDVRGDAMLITLMLKFHQHRDAFTRALEETGDREIVEHSERDIYWGARTVEGGYNGLNRLGLFLMELRQCMAIRSTKEIAELYLRHVDRKQFRVNGRAL